MLSPLLLKLAEAYCGAQAETWTALCRRRNRFLIQQDVFDVRFHFIAMAEIALRPEWRLIERFGIWWHICAERGRIATSAHSLKESPELSMVLLLVFTLSFIAF